MENICISRLAKGNQALKITTSGEAEKTDDGWSVPESLFDVGGDSVWEFHPTVTKDGSLYFCRWDTLRQVGDIYVSRCTDQGCSEPVKSRYP